MEKIRFLNSNEESIVVICKRILRVNDNVIKIIFNEPFTDKELFTHGFDIINENDDDINMSGDYYHSYTTIYNQLDEKTILLSNDGSIYVEPEINESKPYVPTEEELQEIFKANKESKIALSKTLLGAYLVEHPIESNCHNGVIAKYTVTSEKQQLMASNYLTYTIAKESGVENPILTWNAAGCKCEEWTEEEYVTLVLQISEYVKPLVSLQQSYEVAINACTTQDELDAIKIAYDIYGVDENE